jgi:hypothetical protein
MYMNLAPFANETGVMTTTPTRLTNECGQSMAKLERVCCVGNGVFITFKCKSLIILKQIKDAHLVPDAYSPLTLAPSLHETMQRPTCIQKDDKLTPTPQTKGFSQTSLAHHPSPTVRMCGYDAIILNEDRQMLFYFGYPRTLLLLSAVLPKHV